MLKHVWLKNIVLILLLFTLAPGCSLFHKSSRQKAEKKMAKAEAKGNKEYEDALRQHMKNQSKRAERMMKKSKRHSDRLNKGKKKNHSGKHC
jgi:hypothetical protein